MEYRSGSGSGTDSQIRENDNPYNPRDLISRMETLQQEHQSKEFYELLGNHYFPCTLPFSQTDISDQGDHEFLILAQFSERFDKFLLQLKQKLPIIKRSNDNEYTAYISFAADLLSALHHFAQRHNMEEIYIERIESCLGTSPGTYNHKNFSRILQSWANDEDRGVSESLAPVETTSDTTPSPNAGYKLWPNTIARAGAIVTATLGLSTAIGIGISHESSRTGENESTKTPASVISSIKALASSASTSDVTPGVKVDDLPIEKIRMCGIDTESTHLQNYLAQIRDSGQTLLHQQLQRAAKMVEIPLSEKEEELKLMLFESFLWELLRQVQNPKLQKLISTQNPQARLKDLLPADGMPQNELQQLLYSLAQTDVTVKYVLTHGKIMVKMTPAEWSNSYPQTDIIYQGLKPKCQ